MFLAAARRWILLAVVVLIAASSPGGSVDAQPATGPAASITEIAAGPIGPPPHVSPHAGVAGRKVKARRPAPAPARGLLVVAVLAVLSWLWAGRSRWATVARTAWPVPPARTRCPIAVRGPPAAVFS